MEDKYIRIVTLGFIQGNYVNNHDRYALIAGFRNLGTLHPKKSFWLEFSQPGYHHSWVSLFFFRHNNLPSLFLSKGASRLSGGVTTVNQEIGTGGVGGGVGGEVDVGALELLGETVTAHGDHGVPELLGLLGDEVGETGVNVTGGDGVDTGEVAPLVGEGASHVDAASLGDVVGGLLLGEVGDVAGHGGGDDEGAGSALLEVVADGLGAVEGTVQVDLDNVVPGLDGAVEDARVGGGTGVGDEGIDLAEVGNDVLDELLAGLVAVDLALVGLGLDAVGLLEVLDVVLSTLGAGSVGDGDGGAHLGAAASSLNTHALGAGSAGDDDDLALHGELVQEGLMLGCLLARHLEVLGDGLEAGGCLFRRGGDCEERCEERKGMVVGGGRKGL
jgi:hypothetical protein